MSKGFFIEGKVKERKGNHLSTVDHYRGSVDKVLPELAEKYGGVKVKRNLLEKIGHAFDKAGEEMELLLEKEDMKK